MDGKYFYGISGGLLVVAFGVTLVGVVSMKPAWALKNPKETDDKKKEINYTFTILYSLVIAIAVSSVYALAANFFKKDGQLPTAAHGTLVILAVYSITAITLFFSKPKMVLVEGTPEKGLDMVRLNMFAAIAAILVGIVDVMLYKKMMRKSLGFPSASCYKESEVMPASASSSKYKMSFPMKSSCAY